MMVINGMMEDKSAYWTSNQSARRTFHPSKSTRMQWGDAIWQPTFSLVGSLEVVQCQMSASGCQEDLAGRSGGSVISLTTRDSPGVMRTHSEGGGLARGLQWHDSGGLDYYTLERGWQMVVCSIEAGLCRAVRTVRTRQPADQHGPHQLTWTDTPAPSPPGPRQGNLTSSHCDVMCHDVWRDDWPLYSNEMSYSCRSRGGAGGRCHVSFLSPVQSYDVTPRSPPYLTEVKL